MNPSTAAAEEELIAFEKALAANLSQDIERFRRMSYEIIYGPETVAAFYSLGEASSIEECLTARGLHEACQVNEVTFTGSEVPNELYNMGFRCPVNGNLEIVSTLLVTFDPTSTKTNAKVQRYSPPSGSIFPDTHPACVAFRSALADLRADRAQPISGENPRD